jgi:hypothetical protein
MVIAASILLIAAIIAVPWCLFVLGRRMVRGALHIRFDQPRDLPPYGALPGLGPVGTLGELSPNADINTAPSNSHDLYGA